MKAGIKWAKNDLYVWCNKRLRME